MVISKPSKVSGIVSKHKTTKYRLRINKLALKLATRTTLFLLPILIIFAFLASYIPTWLIIVLTGLGAGLIVYILAYYLIAHRVELGRATLQKIQKRKFGRLKALRVPKSDELNALIRQVYRTGRAMQREIDELKKIENYRRAFLGNVSHELKTPIFAINGFTETLLDGALEDQTVNTVFLEKILHHGHRLNALVNDLSEISRIEAGTLKMVIHPFALDELIHDVLEDLAPTVKQQDVKLTYRALSTLPLVLGDRERIRQVMINLTHNAIKYTEAGGHVKVLTATLSNKKEVQVSVVDDGIGVDPKYVPRLTERFYRVDKSRSRQQGGTGLGLAIVKHILEAHGRHLNIESRPEYGSTFSFTLATHLNTDEEIVLTEEK